MSLWLPGDEDPRIWTPSSEESEQKENFRPNRAELRKWAKGAGRKRGKGYTKKVKKRRR